MKRSLLLLLVLTSCMSKQELSEALLSKEGILLVESICTNNEYFDGIGVTAKFRHCVQR